jgi:hypothetical protein
VNIRNVLAAVAVSDLDNAKRWDETLFDRPADADLMPGLAEWRTPGGVVQLVVDQRRTAGSLVTLWDPDARQALDDLSARGEPAVKPDDSTSDNVLFATVTDLDGNAITVVEVREGAQL